MAQSFLVICPNVSRTFVELRVEMPYWCTVLVGFGKYNLLEAFKRISLIWIFQVKSLEILRPNNFTLSTTSKASPLMRMGSNSWWDFVKDIRISLHLLVFRWTLFSSGHCTTLCVIRWALLSSLSQKFRR